MMLMKVTHHHHILLNKKLIQNLTVILGNDLGVSLYLSLNPYYSHLTIHFFSEMNNGTHLVERAFVMERQ